ncbi:MAG: DUF799 domain-containing protein [Candidatus Cloacimonetes bacterium]|jgi:hypothetical protein|nr:DUF799 domain-containing protein [Candidatus Cloacimonadota bacterium]
MNRVIGLILVIVTLTVMYGCSTAKLATLQELYPEMYSRKPASILILPPINKTTAADAKEYFSCSLNEALGLKGYYPIPVEAVYGILREEGLYDTETINRTVLNNMQTHFGADMVLYTSIEKWDKSWFLTSGNLSIEVHYALVSTATADTLWNFKTTSNTRLGSSSDNLFVSMIESAIKTAVEDYFPNARDTNLVTFEKALPVGKYHTLYGLDGENTTYASKKGVINIDK